MATIQTSIQLIDRVSSPIQNMISALDSMCDAYMEVQSTMDSSMDTSRIIEARQQIDLATADMAQFAQQVNKAQQEQEDLTNEARQTQKITDSLADSVMGLVGAYVGMQGIQKITAMSDEFTQTSARIAMINDGMQDTSELMDKIFASAQRSRAEFTATADMVAKLSLNAGDAFKSNDETIQFAENLNKLFAIAGTNQESMASASLQLTQALGSGVLRGEEFNAVFEAAPNIMQEVAEYMGVGVGQLRAMAAEGQITADVVKNALLGATEEINTQFEQMPMTWAQVWTSITNQLYYASMPLLQVINLLAQNWSIIQPIVLGLIGILAVYLLATKGAEMATWALATAQSVLNSVMAMNPIAKIAMIMIAVIAIIYAVIAAINKVQETTISATGLITGVVYALFAFLWDIVADFVNFFANVWTDPIGSIVRLFAGLADTVLGLLELIASGIDAVFGSDLASSVAGWRSSLSGLVKDKYGEGVEISTKMGVIESYNKGYEFGQGISKSVGGMFGNMSGLGNLGGLGGLGGFSVPDYSELVGNVGDIAANTGGIADTLEVTSEDLKYLNDIAEREVINRFTTAEIKVDMTNNNNINKSMDIDGVIDHFVNGLNEALSRTAEGVYA
jgi:tape measure domain-containing protein